MTVVLAARGLCAGYAGHAVVRDLELEVREGEVVSLLGANGAGKTTALRTLAGALRPISGVVELLDRRRSDPLHRRARAGLAYVSEERSVFMGLTTAENLRVGGVDAAYALELFPELEPLLDRRAGLLSGGEQQMLTLSRALARSPKVLLADELSLGLAPQAVRRLLDAVRRAADQGVGVLLVEQHVQKALQVADRVYLMRRGEIVLEGPSADVADRLGDVEEHYLQSGV